PVQLLMLNLVSDGAPALALGLEKGEPNIMKRPPRPTDEPVINRTMQIGTVVQAVVMTAAVLTVFALARRIYPNDPAHAQTIAFCTLCFSELFRAFTARSQFFSLLSIGILSNRWMLWATAGSALIVLTAIYVPMLQPVFNTVPLGLYDWLLMFPFMLMDSIAAEVTKVFIRPKAGY
ncbi:MAG: ATPase, partial [Desulfobacteraceae bacterium]